MISAVVIAKNEEKNIQECVEALLLLTDDVVVLDTGSEDKTIEIAKEAGAQVHEIPWQGYGPTKNRAPEFSKHKWILSIDADEVLTDELIQEIKNTKLIETSVYSINILTNYCGSWIKHSGWFPSFKKRLYHSDFVHWDDREVHENLVLVEGAKVVNFQHVLKHYSYRTAQDHIVKGKRYALLGAEQLIKSEKNVSWIKQNFGPGFRFFRMYILKLGILDRKAGFLLALREARMVAWRYAFYREMRK